MRDACGRAIPTIQVAGTNGKGSVAAYAASILRAAGYVTGEYTSPHIVDETERIRVNGACIPPAELAARMDGQDTIFHQYTRACVGWFAAQGVQAAVLETGLGARLDPVTALGADVLVLTPIGLDHTAVLGETIEQIAIEKCAAIRQRGRVVCMPQDERVLRVVQTACSMAGARLDVLRAEDVRMEADGFAFDAYRGLAIRALGMRQPQNACAAILACEALEEVGVQVSPEAVRRGLADAEIPARIQYFPEEQMVVDGGHNPDALAELIRTLGARFAGRPVVLLCAALAGKDVSALKGLARRAAHVVVTQVCSPRALPAQALAGLFGCGEVIADARAALARAKAVQGDALLVCAGSMYLAGEVLAAMGGS